jgi:hypothetical protein
MPTATFAADFSDFNADTIKAAEQLGVLDKQSTNTQRALTGMTGSMNTFGKAASETTPKVVSLKDQYKGFDNTLQAAGVNIGSEVKMISELGDVAGKTASQFGLLGTAGLVIGTFMAAWKIGTKIDEWLGLSKAIGDATASMLGWTTAAGGAGSKADTLARASAIAKREITDFNEALKIIRGSIDQVQTAFARANAPAEAAKAVAAYHKELSDLRKAGVLDDLKRDLEAGVVSQQELARLYHVSAGALGILTTAQAAHKSRVEEINAANEKAVALQDKLFGRELTAKAQEYAAAIGSVSNVHKMLPSEMAAVNTTMIAAATHLAAIGLGASEAARKFRELALATTDWAKVNAEVAKKDDGLTAALNKRRETFRATITDQMNLNQGITEGQLYWAHAGEIADKAMTDAAAATKTTTAAVVEQTQQVNALAGSFAVVSRSAQEWRAQAAQMSADAARMEQMPGASTTGWEWQYQQNLRTGAANAMAAAGRQAALDQQIASANVNAGAWGGGNYRQGWTVNVNAMQGINGDQIANELVAGMRRRGVSPGGV